MPADSTNAPSGSRAPDAGPIDIGLAAQCFSAVGSEARLAVLRALVRAGPQGLSIGAIQKRLEIPASTLSHHLRFLAAGGLIVQQKQGRTVINRADYARIEALAAFLLHECCVECVPVAVADERHAERRQNDE